MTELHGEQWEWNHVEYPSPGPGSVCQQDPVLHSCHHILQAGDRHLFDLFVDKCAPGSSHSTPGSRRDESPHNHLQYKHPAWFVKENVNPEPASKHQILVETNEPQERTCGLMSFVSWPEIG